MFHERSLYHSDIECFHSRGRNLCKFIGTKGSVCIRKEFNSQRTGLGNQHGRRFIVLGHQYGRRDVMWKHSMDTAKLYVQFFSSLGHPNKMFRFPSPDRPIFFRKVKNNSRLTSQRSKYFNLQAHDLVLLTTIGILVWCDILVFN